MTDRYTQSDPPMTAGTFGALLRDRIKRNSEITLGAIVDALIEAKTDADSYYAEARRKAAEDAA